MRAVRISFFQMLKFIRSDMMLLAAGVSPFGIGIVIRFGIPFIEKLLVRVTGLSCVLESYYGLFDIFYAAITPAMFCFVAAMVMLEEHDDHIDRYLFATTLGRSGYLASRIVVPAFAAFLITVVLLPVFRLSALLPATMLFLALAGTLQGIIIALLVVTISSNKLEGMALTKLASLLMLGAVAPYFIERPKSYLLAFMPSYWTGLAIVEGAVVYMLPAIAVSGAWILILWRQFSRKF